MTQIKISAEGPVAGTPEDVYGYIADYRRHHPRFLPDAFSDMRVEEGGVGAGTVVTYRLKVAGRTSDARATIAEPEPGRVLEETVVGAGIVTTFTVLPTQGGSTVRIDTRWQSAPGIKGWIERTVGPRLLHKLYIDELARLDNYAAMQAHSMAGGLAHTHGG